MRNKKRYWALGLTACMLASVMAGCGSGGGTDSKGSSGGSKDSGTEASGTSSDKEVKLTMLGLGRLPAGRYGGTGKGLSRAASQCDH